MLKCEKLPRTNFTIPGAQYNFSKTSTPQRHRLRLITIQPIESVSESVSMSVSGSVNTPLYPCLPGCGRFAEI